MMFLLLGIAADAFTAPTLGWNTWPTIGCALDCARWPDHCLSERVLMQMIDSIVAGGWSAAGYNYVSVDDCVFTGRDTRGELVADSKRFPSGTLANLSAYAHARGLKLGSYLDFGDHTCAYGHNKSTGKGEYPWGPGSFGHVEADVATLARWGIDHIKVGARVRTHPRTLSGQHSFIHSGGRVLSAFKQHGLL